jgi:gliding motility-associated-like protein
LNKNIAYIITLVFLVLTGMTQKANATHLIGGYMSYQFLEKLPNNEYQYKVTLYMFRDVEQSDVDFDAEINVGVYLNNTALNRTKVISIPLGYRKRVTPPGSEECDYYADKQIEMAFYERTFSLAAYPEGYHLTFIRCCRNKQDNLTLDGNGSPYQGQTYHCFIPNPALQNSSPYFSGVPSPYMCVNDTNSFLNRAIDPDGDSLVYRFVTPYQGGEPTQGGAMPEPPVNLTLPIKEVDYRSGFNSVFPFGNGGWGTINQDNGLTNLYSARTGSYVVAIEVSEYRNGKLFSTVRLDMQILVLKCPPNKKPKGRSTLGNYFEIEAGEELCIELTGTDQDRDPVTSNYQDVTIFGSADMLTGENGFNPPLAAMTTKTANRQVKTEFCWTPSCEHARDKPYLLAVSVQDNGCPPKYDNFNVEIKVNAFKGSDEILGPDRACSNNGSSYLYSAKNPQNTSSFYWDITGGAIIGKSNLSSVTVEWMQLGIGTLRMVEISQFGCPGDTIVKKVTLVPSPSKPKPSGQDTVCLNTMNVGYSVTNNPGSTYEWFLPDGTTSTGTSATYSWNTIGNFLIKVVETNTDGCASDTGMVKVNVRKPVPGISGPTSVCPNAQGIVYTANGTKGSSFTWTVTGGTKVSGGTSASIIINWGNEGLGLIEVVETDRFGCISDVIRYVVNKTYNLNGRQPIGDQDVCEFDASVPYFVVEAKGSVYRWNIVGGNQTAGDSTSKIRVDWGATGNGRVGVQERAYDNVNKRECLSPVVYLDVNIHPIPTANKIEGDFDLCELPDTVIYRVSGFAGSTYVWEVNGSTNNIIGQGSSQIKLVWKTAGTYSIRVTELSKDSCPGQPIDSQVFVRPKPISTTIDGLQTVCFPGHLSVDYAVQGYPNSTYSWSVVGGSFPSSNAPSIVVDWNESGFGEVRVVEVSEYGCVGDTLLKPVYINNLQLDLEVVSVGFPDNRMHGAYITLNDDLKTGNFEIQKRVGGTEDNWLTILNEPYTTFLETDLNTDLVPFQYRIKATDLCGNDRLSDEHTNILLTGTQNSNDFSLTLQFTPYLGWKNGASIYTLYRSKNASFNLVPLMSMQPGNDNAAFIPGNSEDYRQCFRVKADEQGGGSKFSWSNEICFYFRPDVFVPTAFTPNGDGINDGFHPVSVAVQDYVLRVYNRWGEKIFETADQKANWDGTFLGVDSPGGIYMYIVDFSDYDGKRYQKNGTVQLMR